MSLSAMDKAPGLPALRDARMGGEPLPVITLLDILRTVFRYKWPIASILTIAVLGALGYLMMTAPIYTAESKLLVRVGREKLTPFVVGTQPSNNFMFGERVENVNDQIEILRSPTIMAQVFPILKQRYLDILAAGQYRPEPVTLLDHIRYWTREAKNRAMAGYRWVKDMIHEPLSWLG